MPSPTIVLADNEDQAIEEALDGKVAVLQTSWVEPIKTRVFAASGAIKVALGKSCKYTEVAFKKGVSIREFAGNPTACVDDLARLAGTTLA